MMTLLFSVAFCLLLLSAVVSPATTPAAASRIVGQEDSGHDNDDWVVLAKRISSSHPIISKDTTRGACDFPYNPALFPLPTGSDDGARSRVGALVRCQNLTQPPYTVAPSVMCSSVIDPSGRNASQTMHIAFQEDAVFEKCGTEDPRVVKWGDEYFLFYTAYDCTKAMLSLAVTRTPFNASSWTRHGPLFPNAKWSKSGAAILGRKGKQYLIWGDSALTPALHVAVSEDGIKWTNKKETILSVRKSPYFDTNLVEAGPPPLPLPHSNHLLFLYNSARQGFPSPKPGYSLQYNVGFAILNASDPSHVLQRSSQPLLSPTLPWEVGNTTAYLTPNVVFVEGMVPASTPLTDLECPRSHIADGRFLALYGAADSAVGSVEIVACKRHNATPTH
ncbi:hypothetical protein PTSG_02003 [Salpingoeca rosetta]|uniref:Uncharacterized protein n=1 Tax=Salpingoeca rosetta (strain ATCC 50818 / BSB-021) TaxID=946362 RepID=F2TZL1_SALR5|nr:uncharacterized protein PTSG_02003 [Salpingoeca rosetta]EGD79035.1 hypothetical protein PTSG_02003 [Salpingoeca rosetta]|eukprot:XP_004997991.1 hypothetical protein PTSG_02003 [Salpingoeca rosetta]